jgi:hypothetical protein
MSFAGFYRVLCRNGHLHSEGISFCCGPFFEPGEREEYGDLDSFHLPDLWKCPDCGELAGWQEMIDQTNGYDPESETKLDEVTPDEYQTCDMGHQHRVKVATYRMPKESGHAVNGGLK